MVDFGTVEVGDRVAHTEQDVIAALRRISAHRPVFFKDTTDFHYPAVLDDETFLLTVTHTFIIRDPIEAIASHHALNQNLGRDEIGFARDVSDRVAYFHEGVIEELGPPSQVIESPQSEHTRKFLANVR